MRRSRIKTVRRFYRGRDAVRGEHSRPNTRGRRLLCEALEGRRLLSVGPYPDLPGLHPEDLRPDQSAAPGDITGTIDEHQVSIDRHDAPGLPVDNSVPSWLLIHGWNSSPARFDDLADAIYAESAGDQVLTLDWSEAADSPWPWHVEGHILDVAIWAADALTAYGFTGTLLNLVGHSFGAYVAAEMAERVTGGVNTIVGLDPAVNVPFNAYNPDGPGEIDFAEHSSFSWVFSDGGGSAGSAITPESAHEAFAVENTGHSEVVDLFWNMLSDVGNADVLQYFPLSRLVSYTPGPWVPNQYTKSGNPSSGGTYEAVITADASLTVAHSIDFVPPDLAPTITATQRNDGAIRPGTLTSLTFSFSEDVGTSIGASDLTIHNDSTGEEVDLSALTAGDLAYDPVLHTARWDLSGISFTRAYYTYTLNSVSITDLTGNELDGDGDGVGGDDYSDTLMVALNGDINLDGSVNLADLVTMGHPNHWGQSGLTWLEGDLDLNGDVNTADLIILGDPSNWDKSLGIAGVPGAPPSHQVVYEPLQPPTRDEQTAYGPKLPRFASMLGVPRAAANTALDGVSEDDSDEADSQSSKTELNPGLLDLLAEEQTGRRYLLTDPFTRFGRVNLTMIAF